MDTDGAEARAKAGGADYSTTNVQEAGVDEPDIVKTAGRRIVALAQGKLQVVSLGAPRPRLVGSLREAMVRGRVGPPRLPVLAGHAPGRARPRSRAGTGCSSIDAATAAWVRPLALSSMKPALRVGAARGGSGLRVLREFVET